MSRTAFPNVKYGRCVADRICLLAFFCVVSTKFWKHFLVFQVTKCIDATYLQQELVVFREMSFPATIFTSSNITTSCPALVMVRF